MKSKKIAIVFLSLLTLSFVIGFIYFLWHRYNYAVSNAVFVKADKLVYVNFSKVNGRIKKLYKNEGEKVKKGELLAIIENKDYQYKLKALQHKKNELLYKIKALEKNINKHEKDIELKLELQKETIQNLSYQKESLLHDLQAIEAQLSQVSKDLERYKRLYKKGLISLHALEQIETNYKQLKNKKASIQAQIEAIENQIDQATKNIELILNQKKSIQAEKLKLKALLSKLQALESQIKEAKVYVKYTKLYSPISGIIAKRFVSEGDFIAPGKPVYAIVDPKSFYILVLLEETKLKGVKPGCKAYITLDAYPKEKFEGIVEEILPASAATFALVPRDISAGEFTKLVQRIPVKIKITKGNLSLLKVGLSGEVEIKRIFK